MKPFLLPYVTAGNGHRSASMSLKEAFEREDKPCVTVDVLNFSDRVFRMIYSNIYEVIGEHSHSSCGAIYKLTDQDREESHLVKLVDRLSEISLNQFRSFITDNDPPAVICTHFLPQAILAKMKTRGLYSGQVYSCITDFDLHRMWFCHGIDGYFVSNRNIRDKLIHLGVDGEKIEITGIPVNSKFCNLPRKSGPMDSRMRILFSGRSISDKKVFSILEGLNDLELPLDLEIITGRNEALFDRLKDFSSCPPVRINIHGFVDNMDELMTKADLMITKPGGLTISEALCAQLPMILFSPIPFQETKNAIFLDSQGAGCLCEDIKDVLNRISQLFHCPEKIEKMKNRCSELARPMASSNIVKRVIRRDLSKVEGIFHLPDRERTPTGTGVI